MINPANQSESTKIEKKQKNTNRRDDDSARDGEPPMTAEGSAKENATTVLGETQEQVVAAREKIGGATSEALTSAMESIVGAADQVTAAGDNADQAAKSKLETARGSARRVKQRAGEVAHKSLTTVGRSAKSAIAAAHDATVAVEKRAEALADKAKDITRRYESETVTGTLADERQMRLGYVAYLLFALGPFTVLSSLLGLFLCYLRLGEETVTGTVLRSHFRWLIRTFWLSAGLLVMAAVLAWAFGNLAGGSVLLLVLVWFAYRVLKGWLALYDGKQLEKPSALL